MSKEREVKAYIYKRAKEEGYVIRKARWEGYSGAPDQRILGKCWVELKKTNGKPRPIQEHEIELMRKHGEIVYVIDSKEQVDELMETLRNEV